MLEVGGAPGAAAREVARRIDPGHILVIDRSEKGVFRIESSCRAEIEAGILSVRCTAIEDFRLQPDDERFDLVFANRVGVLDGRHSKLEAAALGTIRAAALPGAQFFLDGRDVTHKLSE